MERNSFIIVSLGTWLYDLMVHRASSGRRAEGREVKQLCNAARRGAGDASRIMRTENSWTLALAEETITQVLDRETADTLSWNSMK